MADKTPAENSKKTEKDGRTAALSLAIGQIEKQFGKGSILRLGEAQ